MIKNLDNRQQEIIADFFQQVPLMQEISLLEYDFSNMNYKVAYSELVLEDSVLNLVFTVGLHSNRVFIAITDGDPRQVSFLLANIEQYDHDVKMVNTCESIGLPNSEYLEKNNCVGAVMLRACVSPIISEFRDTLTLADKTVIQYMLAVFISKREYEYFLEKGFDSLLDFFQENGKDIYSIKQN